MARPRKSEDDRKVPIQLRLNRELYDWLEENIGTGKRFGSRTHAIEAGLILLKDREEGRDPPSRASRSLTSKK